MKFARRPPPAVELNLTPLIDVVFLLLIFFMVSTTFDTPRGLELTLPASRAGSAPAAPALTLTVSAAGDYRLDERALSGAELGPALAARAEAARRGGLVVAADARAAHGDVVRALDQAAALGIRRVRIATRPAPEVSHSPTAAERP